jgi:aminoglycoside 3-N-acetyltransferase
MQIFKKKFTEGLKKIGIKNGDLVFCHSSLFPFKKRSKKKILQLCNNIFKSFFEVIGSNGTLVVPTFTYSVSNNKPYFKNKSKQICGYFSEYVRKKKKSLIYNDPNVSVAVVGNLKKKLTKNPTINSYAKNSFFDRFVKLNGKICNINLDAATTFIHYFERKCKVNYRYDKKFYGLNENKKIACVLYVRKLKKKYEVNFKKFNKEVFKKKYYKTFSIGESYVGAININEVENIVIQNLKKDKHFLVNG